MSSSATTTAVFLHKPWLLLLLLLRTQQLVAAAAGSFTNHSSMPAVACLPDQASALLRLRRSFSITNASTFTFRSWRAGTDCCRWEGIRCGMDCCHWEGVRCGDGDGRVTWLDLGDCHLESSRLHPALFKLTSLKYLNLGGNNFNLSEIPSAGFERLGKLTHLNLSSSNFAGQVPAHSIGQLTNLVSLDLSFRYQAFELFDNTFGLNTDARYLWQLALPNLTALVANLRDLNELHLGFVDQSNQEAEWCNALGMYTPNLRVLSLPFCLLYGPICGSLSGLHSLSVIDLQYNHLTGPIPEFFANFSSLSVIQLKCNHLEGWVSPTIFQNKKLVTIDLHRNLGLSGTLPDFPVGSSLDSLHVGQTNFSGTIPSSISNLRALKELGLGGYGFYGKIPSSIGTMKSLNLLQVSGLELVGSIPTWITNLTSLVVLEFSHCGLSGSIPSSIGDLKHLRTLALYNCKFSGEMPRSIYNLTLLDTLFLPSNNFIGTVELASFWTLANLSDLNLSDNKLTVVDGENNSSRWASFPSITFLSLASCNITRFLNIFRPLNNKMIGIDLSRNQIQGAIPHWALEKWTESVFYFLNLSHNSFTSVGYDSFLPFYTARLDLSFNMFEGPIPLPKFFKIHIHNPGIALDYSNNRFTSMPSNISTQLEDTAIFKASKNNLSGNISAYFCTAANLKFLDLSYNYLSGSIPSCLIEDANALQVLNLKQNQLHGELPHDINGSCTLEVLDLSDNRIEGNLPRSLASCQSLEVFDIQNNQINDSFPCWMSALPRLQVLVLKSNKFFGQMTCSVAEVNTCEFPRLRILDVASNNFSGTLEEEWFKRLKSMMTRSSNDTSVMKYNGDQGQVYQVTIVLTYKGYTITIDKILRAFVFIDISNNAFHGSIPEAMGELVLLHTLNMSHNSLRGSIPSQLSRLDQMETLDLSSNELSGVIPEELASLNFLTTLNLSYNKLEGRIPESPHFLTFSNSSFLRNDGLCGPPLSKRCSNMTSLEVITSKNSVGIMLFLFSGLGFGLGFAISIVVTWAVPIRKWSHVRQRDI